MVSLEMAERIVRDCTESFGFGFKEFDMDNPKHAIQWVRTEDWIEFSFGSYLMECPDGLFDEIVRGIMMRIVTGVKLDYSPELQAWIDGHREVRE